MRVRIIKRDGEIIEKNFNDMSKAFAYQRKFVGKKNIDVAEVIGD